MTEPQFIVAEMSKTWTGCGDDLDCPQPYLDQSVPLGSVVVRFVDSSPRAAINVVDWRYSASIRLGTRAWLARWMPESG